MNMLVQAKMKLRNPVNGSQEKEVIILEVNIVDRIVLVMYPAGVMEIVPFDDVFLYPDIKVSMLTIPAGARGH